MARRNAADFGSRLENELLVWEPGVARRAKELAALVRDMLQRIADGEIRPPSPICDWANAGGLASPTPPDGQDGPLSPALRKFKRALSTKLRAEAAARLDVSRRAKASEMSDQQSKHEGELSRLRQGHAAHIERLKETYASELEEHKEEFVRQLSGKTSSEIVSRVRREMLHTRHTKVIDLKNAEIKALADTLAERDAAIALLGSQLGEANSKYIQSVLEKRDVAQALHAAQQQVAAAAICEAALRDEQRALEARVAELSADAAGAALELSEHKADLAMRLSKIGDVLLATRLPNGFVSALTALQPDAVRREASGAMAHGGLKLYNMGDASALASRSGVDGGSECGGSQWGSPRSVRASGRTRRASSVSATSLSLSLAQGGASGSMSGGCVLESGGCVLEVPETSACGPAPMGDPCARSPDTSAAGRTLADDGDGDERADVATDAATDTAIAEVAPVIDDASAPDEQRADAELAPGSPATPPWRADPAPDKRAAVSRPSAKPGEASADSGATPRVADGRQSGATSGSASAAPTRPHSPPSGAAVGSTRGTLLNSSAKAGAQPVSSMLGEVGTLCLDGGEALAESAARADDCTVRADYARGWLPLWRSRALRHTRGMGQAGIARMRPHACHAPTVRAPPSSCPFSPPSNPHPPTPSHSRPGWCEPGRAARLKPRARPRLEHLRAGHAQRAGRHERAPRARLECVRLRADGQFGAGRAANRRAGADGRDGAPTAGAHARRPCWPCARPAT